MDRFSHWLRPAVMYRRRSWRGRTPAAAAPEPAMVSVPTTVPNPVLSVNGAHWVIAGEFGRKLGLTLNRKISAMMLR